MTIDLDKEQHRAQLLGSLLEFTRFFYEDLTKRPFIISQPIGRESHHITVARELTNLFRVQKEAHGLDINIPPGYGKSVMVCMFVSWCYAHYSDCNFIYISYSHELAAAHTSFIKQVMSLPKYRYLFDVEISRDTRAKDHFRTNGGGEVAAFGSSGAVTGRNAGSPGLNRFSGAVIIDDAHKPNEVHSDSIRETVKRNYRETILQRPRDIRVPILFMGQRLHEDDLPAYLLSGEDVRKWDTLILKGLDDAGNALYPEVQNAAYLKELKEKHPFVFSSQIQQEPIPSGGSLFKEEWFHICDFEPEIIYTFITADTAETSKSYNDASVFSFWGLYEVETMGRKTGQYALHWLDCLETRVEPKDLKDVFLDFWGDCMRHKVIPMVAAIEKKSTGVTLLSVLKELRGMQMRDIERNASSGSKTARFLAAQPYIASKLISFTKDSRHMKMCIDHMTKITATDSHRHDDICFVKDTKIATSRGEVNIQDIKIGDRVITPFGLGDVIACGTVGHTQVIKNMSLEGTPDHPVFYKSSFERLDTVTDEYKIDKLSLIGLLKWNYKKLSYSMESPIGSWGRKDIILVSQRKCQIEKAQKAFMWRFGNIFQVNLYRKAMLFIIKTTITSIIILKIWSVYRAHNILKTMRSIEIDGSKAKKEKVILKKCKNWLKSGTKAMREFLGIEKMQKQVLISQEKFCAQYVGMGLKLDRPTENFAVKNATTSKKQKEQESREPLKKEVFNLTVERFGVYYANGILVSNCDTAVDAIQLALIDKSIRIDNDNSSKIADTILSNQKNTLNLRRNIYGRQ